MIRVHHLNNSRSHRILWLLEELGLAYAVTRYERDSKTMLAPPELKQVHPLGKSPVLEADGEVLAESGAIVETLVEKHGAHLRPETGTQAWRRYVYWLHFAEGSAMTPLLLKLYFSRLGDAAAPVMGRIDGQIAAILDFLEAEAGSASYLAGDRFTAADIQMSFPLELAVQRGGLDESRPRLWAYLARIRERPAYHRALERGGRYDFAPR